MIKYFFALFCFAILGLDVAVAAPCQAEGAYDQFAFQPPDGFVELRARRMTNGITYAFREDKRETEMAIVMQLVFNYTQDDFSLLKPEHREEVKEVYLNRYLGGLEARRGDFKKTEIVTENLGNSAYKKIAWLGKAGSEDMKGVMYVTVTNNVVTVINIQIPLAGDPAAEKALNECLDTLKLTLD